MKQSEVPPQWRHLRKQTLETLKARDWWDPRMDKYGSLAPTEKGLTGEIYTSIAYGFQWADAAAGVFEGTVHGDSYPRLPDGTPETRKLAKKILELELGKNHPDKDAYDVLLTASGMSAIVALTCAMLPDGGEFISSPYVYGGTYAWFDNFARKKGMQCFFVKDPRDLDEWESAMRCRPQAKFLFWEETPNPTPFNIDGASIVRLAQNYGRRTFCDSTIPTQVFSKPLLYGVDGVIHSISKNFGGKSRGLGGALPAIKDVVAAAKEWNVVLGSVMDPRVADYMLWGSKTLYKRMKRKSGNACVIAKFLRLDKRVKKVHWAGSDLMSFELHGTLQDAKKVVEAFNLILMAPHLGDDYALGIHPASTTHSKVPQEERVRLGISDTLVRLSVGLFDPVDIFEDISQALDIVFGKI